MELHQHNSDCPGTMIHVGETYDGAVILTCAEPGECPYKYVLNDKEAQEFSDAVFA